MELDRAWLQYFGDMELGELRDTADFVQSTICPEFQDVHFTPDPGLVPSLSELESIMRGTRTDKAMGLDRIPGELLKGAPSRLAAILQPLFTKAVLRGRQPLQWRGGLLVEALKKVGLESKLSGHRSLFVGSVVGKAYHRYVRSKLIDRTEEVLRDTHCGARRGSTVAQAPAYRCPL